MNQLCATVLAAHTHYQQPGGEDRVFSSETALLERNGHRVVRYEDWNSRIASGIRTATGAIWSQHTYSQLRTLTKSTVIDLAHFHNTFPLISPSGYYAVQRAAIPVVQTLHNFRLICAGATLSRSGAACDACVKYKSVLPSIAHGCYRGSRAATLAVAAMLATHHAAGTHQGEVDLYIALSEFARRKFVEGGLCRDRIVVKPNFVSPDPGAGEGLGSCALFAGRLAEEKGVRTLAAAWRTLENIPLQVAGDGPLRNIDWPKNVMELGPQPNENVMRLMRQSQVLIFPSSCYECAPMTIIEAFACGLPVIASDLGSIPEFVQHGYNGLLFRPGDPEDLARQVRWAFDHPEQLRAMRANARREYEQKYTAERNYKMLIDIYEMAIENAHRRRRNAS